MSGIPVGHKWPSYNYASNGVSRTHGGDNNHASNNPNNTITITDKMLHVDVFPLSNYTFGTKGAVHDEYTDENLDDDGRTRENNFKSLRFR